MLLQSHAGFVHVLPALPSSWAEGNVQGLRSRGGFIVTDLRWKMGKVVSLKIKSTVGGNLRLGSNAQLKMADGTSLTAASGTNANPLMQPYTMPEPVVVDKSKIPDTHLATTYLYDIPTVAGQEIELVDIDTPAGIGNITQQPTGTASSDCAYAVDGTRAGEAYKGVVVMKGRKLICK